MRSKAQIVARFGLLAALSLVLGYFDRAIPITWLLGGAVPGIKLGLANTVLLYAVYLMDWRSCVALMLTKVFLSGFLFGSMSAILYSLSGGVLSLIVMLLARKNARAGALTIAALTAVSDIWLLYRNPRPGGQMLICVILIALACAAAVAAFVVIRIRPEWGVLGVSLAGAVAHNVGQILMASRVLRTPQLLYTYLPVLVGIGAVVGTLTGLVAQRVFRALRIETTN
ncbi:MAG: Gx transporter family protein [Clostridia bacterium]|nr:Gx transporter family protein [Clostridia bacterium]